MDVLLQQLGLNGTFFVEFGIVAIVCIFLSNVFFKPFLYIFELRHKKTIRDQKLADSLMADVLKKWETYRLLIQREKFAILKNYEFALCESRNKQSSLLAEAQMEAKKITSQAVASVMQQRKEISAQLSVEASVLSSGLFEKFLSGLRRD